MSAGALSQSSSLALSAQPEAGCSHLQKVKLRLCYGGRFEQTANNTYKFVGGEYFNESIPYGIRYADFMFKLSEKFRTAVSVKYHAPGEELVPDQLISVQDDADLQELVEDYLAHLQLPGTPRKTFRIKVFVFMAAEEPLTPDEIMEGQYFFSECQQGLPARLSAVRLLDGRSSLGSTLSSVGTPSTRHQDLSVGDWPKDSAGQPIGLGLDELEPVELLDEQEALERMRTAVSCNPSQRMRQQQRRLSAFAGLQQPEAIAPSASAPGQLSSAAAEEAGGLDAGGGAALRPTRVVATDPGLYDDSAYEEELGGSVLRQISQEMDEVLEAIDAQQKQSAAAGPAPARGMQQGAMLQAGPAGSSSEEDEQLGYGCYAGTYGEQSDEHSDAPMSQPAASEAWDYEEDALDQQQCLESCGGHKQQQQQPQELALPALQQQPQHWGHADSVDSLVRALPTHISDFGESAPDDSSSPASGSAAGGALRCGSCSGEAAAHHLPSHISAFGDDLGPLPAGRGVLGGSEDGDEAGAAGPEPDLAAQMVYARPRTQDSSFSLDGGGLDDVDTPGAPGGIHPERAASGDSLASLPKLQPVHRLAKPDLKIVQRIGEGAFGEVSVAKAPLYGTVAVKWLKTERFTKHFASFGREAALLADLNHPNVLRFYGVVTESAADREVIGIMTEFIRGGSMSNFLRMSRTLLPLRVRCELALGAANGLAYLHELRIVHFDLKPDNLLLDAPLAVVRAAAQSGCRELPRLPVASPRAGASYDDSSSRGNGFGLPGSAASSQEQCLHRHGSGVPATSPNAAAASHSVTHRTSSGLGALSGSGLLEALELPVVKVADFGLSKCKRTSSYVSSCKDLRGTLPYMAPELLSDPDRVSEKADVWSLGVVMWEMLTRETPFQELRPQEILSGLMSGTLQLDIPPWCEPEWRYLLEACMDTCPSNRPTMRELSRQLEAIRDQQLLQEEELQTFEAQQLQQQEEEAVGALLQQQQQQQRTHESAPQASPGQHAGAAEVAAAQPGVLLPQNQQQPQQHDQQPPMPRLLHNNQAHQHQVQQQRTALPGAVVSPAAGADAGAYGAVCDHYWPQQSPHVLAAGPCPGHGQL